MGEISSPLAGTQNVTLLRVIQGRDLIERWQREYGIDVTAELRGHQEIHLYRCETTGLEFYWPRDVNGSSRLYEQLQKYEWYYEPHKWEHRVALKDLKSLGKARVMEVGCGDGAFVADALRAGIDVRGIEINPAAVQAAKSRGLPVEHIDLSDAATNFAGSMDAVCAFQVLEHVSDPRGFLEHCVRMLKAGGVLILCVPNAESFLKDQSVLLDMPPHHMLRWSVRSFASLTSLMPVDLVLTRLEPLRRTHVGSYAAARCVAWRRKAPALAWLFGKPTRAAIGLSMRAGLRHLATGQSLYALLRRQNDTGRRGGAA
jgi:2-polyprenyl-3-methyl-5-hydroxy-6-metoxy-1,4-benzoquinol methylase